MVQLPRESDQLCAVMQAFPARFSPLKAGASQPRAASPYLSAGGSSYAPSPLGGGRKQVRTQTPLFTSARAANLKLKCMHTNERQAEMVSSMSE